jgi:hypothetical protein
MRKKKERKKSKTEVSQKVKKDGGEVGGEGRHSSKEVIVTHQRICEDVVVV